MKKKLSSIGGKRGLVISLLTLAAILVLLVGNLILTYFGVQKTLFIDNTPEGLYTLSDTFKRECSFIDEKLGSDGKKVKVTFCSDPDVLLDSLVTRLAYFTALEAQNTFDNLEVETVNVTYNPTAVSKYRPTSLSVINPTDIIISYGDRYTVVNLTSFWLADGDTLIAYNGEYKLASLIMSVTKTERPVAYFATGHGETYYDAEDPESEGSVKTAYFYDLLRERGLEVKTVDLTKVNEIPEDCVLLIINNPTDDFLPDESKLGEFSYISPLGVIDRYLIKNHGSVMVAKDYETALPEFESFLHEWGFKFGTSLVKDQSPLVGTSGNATAVPGVYNTDKNSYGYMLYSEFATLSSAPTTVFANTGYLECVYGTGTVIPEDGAYSVERTYEPLFFSTDTAKAYGQNGITGEYTDVEKIGSMHLAAVSTRSEYDTSTVEFHYSDIFCAASGDFFSNEFLGNASYANYQIVSVLTEHLIREEAYASPELGGEDHNYNSSNFKILETSEMYESAVSEYNSETGKYETVTSGLDSTSRTVLVVLITLFPIAILIFGTVVCIKRRFL